jgi:hypothetical protein
VVDVFRTALLVTTLILLAGLSWMFAYRAERHHVRQHVQYFFGEVIDRVKMPKAYWQRYLEGLQTDLARIGLEKFSVAKYAKYVPVGLLVFLGGSRFVFGVPIWIGGTMAVLLLLLPRQVVSELSARYIITIRKRLIADVISPGIHALGSGSLEDVCEEIAKDAKSPIIRREFAYINELGRAPGDWNVAKAMMVRAQALHIPEFETLAKLTSEGQRHNAKLTEIWRDAHDALTDKVQAQSSLLADISIYRTVGTILFLTLVFVVTFGYPQLHVHGAIQLGLFITLISYFIGVSQVAKTKHV